MSVLQEGFEAVAKGLREFGYPSVTTEQIAEAHTRWKAGDKAEGVIQMFAFKDFDEHPTVFGAKE